MSQDSLTSPTISPKQKMAYKYRNTQSHHKTLSVLGSVKKFENLSIEELSGYCGLVKNENKCESAADAAHTLNSRFKWRTNTRLSDIEEAWKILNDPLDEEDEEEEEEEELVGSQQSQQSTNSQNNQNSYNNKIDTSNEVDILEEDQEEKEKDKSPLKNQKKKPAEKEIKKENQKYRKNGDPKEKEKKIENQKDNKNEKENQKSIQKKKLLENLSIVLDTTDKNPEKNNEKLPPAAAISASNVPIIIRNNAWERKVLLCEVDDPEFNISGDFGAIGRISAVPDSLLIDIKG